jgi:RNA polymerase sigma-70 factor (ECF subfamily)
MALRVDDVDLVRDRALVERFQEGDPAAFETLFKRYFDRLTRFCQKRVGDRHEAEEIAQEAFTRALRALPTFEGERRFYPWMTVIAGRLCVDSHRRRGRSEPTAMPDLGVIEGGQEKIVDAVDIAILGQALGRLAPRHREVLDLREQQSWSYQQIADHYGVTLGTVEALLFRARKALRREFLAVVGDERSWAALPVAGLLLRRLGSLRARFQAWLGALPAISAPAVMVAAIAVTAVAGVGMGVYEQRQAAEAAAARGAAVRMASGSAADSARFGPAELPGPGRSAASTAAPVGPDGALNSGPRDRAANPYVGWAKDYTKDNREYAGDGRTYVGGAAQNAAGSVDRFDDGHDATNTSDYQPLSTGVGDVLRAGADPGQAAKDMQSNVDHYRDDLIGRTQP